MLTFDLLLKFFVAAMGCIVLVGFINGSTLKLPTPIALMLLSAIGGVIFAVLQAAGIAAVPDMIGSAVRTTSLDSYLMDGVLCFMLFAGSSTLKLSDMKKSARMITSLSIFATLFSAAFYGVLFYGITNLLGLEFNLMTSFLLGCIVSPTDPIAAMSILRKIGLPEDIAIIIEGESLFNDGVGVALFVTAAGIMTHTSDGNFFTIFARELFGAVAIGVLISFLLNLIFSKTDARFRHVYLSLLAVSMSYVVCNYFGFSGAIASVVCGIFFATNLSKKEEEETEAVKYYDYFWTVLDNLLNNILYVVLGVSIFSVVLRAATVHNVLLLGIAAIIINFIARDLGVYFGSLGGGRLPLEWKRSSFTHLLSWSGLKGGLCLAMAMGTRGMVPEMQYQIIEVSTYCIVFFTTIIQGLTVGKIYVKLEKNAKSTRGKLFSRNTKAKNA